MQNKFGTTTFFPREEGYEVICAEHHYRGDKYTGFTNHRFGISNKGGAMVFLNVNGEEFNVTDVAGYFAALRLHLPRLEAVCPPLAEHARKILAS